MNCSRRASAALRLHWSRVFDQIETDTDEKQAALRSSLYEIEKTLDPIDAMFMYQVIELTGEIADMAERVGRRLELLLSH